jgi:hypothetical protein
MLTDRNQKQSTSNRILMRFVLAAVAGAFLAAGAHPAGAYTDVEMTIVCPIDGLPFTARRTASYYQSGMRLDFKPLGALVAPYPHPVCPGNGFVVYRQDFSEQEISAIRLLVNSDEFQQLRRHHTDYFMIAYVKERMGSPAYELAHTYLGATWEAERDQPHLTDQYRELALAKFDASVHGKNTRRDEPWWTASLLAAEMERLLGKFDQALDRIDALPLAELNARNPALRSVADQIKLHALRRNSRPEPYVVEMDEGTVGRQVMLHEAWQFPLSIGAK